MLVPLVEAETRVCGRPGVVSAAAARSLFKLMSYKDEYEVARLYSDGSFRRQLANAVRKLRAAGIPYGSSCSGAQRQPGPPGQESFGRGMSALFPILARLRFCAERRLTRSAIRRSEEMERELLSEFVSDLDFAKSQLTPENTDLVADFVSYPLKIRGYGHVKEANAEQYLKEKHAAEEINC
jgi:indolepyruvate ferredoxin oxidoreductase